MTKLKIIETIQGLTDEKSFLFTRGCSGMDLSVPIVSDELVFRKSARSVQWAPLDDLPFELTDRVEGFDCYAHKKGYTLLGILCFELLFSDQAYIEIQLPNQKSEIKQLFIFLDRNENQHHFLKQAQKETYASFEYFADTIESHYSYYDRGVEEVNLPTFRFGCSNAQEDHASNRVEKADQLILSFTVTGLIDVATLFLDIGQHSNTQNEVPLENPLTGSGGVSSRSLDASFWLPNSFAFFGKERLEDLCF